LRFDVVGHSMRQRFLALLLLLMPLAATAQPHVVVSIKPLQLIAAAVAEPGQQVSLLIDPRQSHHDYQLRPSERRLLAEADVVFWIGPALESFLRRPLGSLSPAVQVEALGESSDLDEHDHAHEAEGPHHHHDHGGVDPHSWLSPAQAVGMAWRMADVLAARDPARAARYRANAGRFEQATLALDAELARQFAAVTNPRPYLVMHDAYGHFERRYGLARAATYTATPEQQPGARHMVELRGQFMRGEIGCVLREAPYRAGPLEAALAGAPNVRVVDLDLLGAEVAPGPDGYLQFLQRFAEAMLTCLQPGAIVTDSPPRP
jgi:zinc transport system substrate-binding protein